MKTNRLIWFFIVLFVTVLQAGPSRSGPMEDANRHYVHEQYVQAMEQYNLVASSTAPEEIRAEALYLVGRCLENRELWQDAAIVYNQVFERYPRSSWRNNALLHAGNCYSQLSKWDRAITAYSQVISTTSSLETQMAARLNRGVILSNPNYSNQDLNKASEDLSYVTANGQDAQQLAEASFALGEVNRWTGNIKEAKNWYNTARNLDRSGVWSGAASNMLAGVNAQQGESQEAIVNLQQVTEDPKSPQPLKVIAQRQVESIQNQQFQTERQPRVPVNYKADQIESGKGATLYRGNVIIDFSGVNVRCDEATVTENEVECRKNVRLKSSGNWIASGDRIVVQLPAKVDGRE